MEIKRKCGHYKKCKYAAHCKWEFRTCPKLAEHRRSRVETENAIWRQKRSEHFERASPDPRELAKFLDRSCRYSYGTNNRLDFDVLGIDKDYE